MSKTNITNNTAQSSSSPLNVAKEAEAATPTSSIPRPRPKSVDFSIKKDSNHKEISTNNTKKVPELLIAPKTPERPNTSSRSAATNTPSSFSSSGRGDGGTPLSSPSDSARKSGGRSRFSSFNDFFGLNNTSETPSELAPKNVKRSSFRILASSIFGDSAVEKKSPQKKDSLSEIGNPLIDAIKKANWQNVENLLDQGFDVDQIDNKGQTALMHAAQVTSPEKINLIRLLIKAGANVNVRDQNDKTALKYAAESDLITGERMTATGEIIASVASLQKNNGHDWVIMQNLDLPDSEVQKSLNQKTVTFLAVILPAGDLLNSIVKTFSDKNTSALRVNKNEIRKAHKSEQLGHSINEGMVKTLIDLREVLLEKTINKSVSTLGEIEEPLSKASAIANRVISGLLFSSQCKTSDAVLYFCEELKEKHPNIAVKEACGEFLSNIPANQSLSERRVISTNVKSFKQIRGFKKESELESNQIFISKEDSKISDEKPPTPSTSIRTTRGKGPNQEVVEQLTLRLQDLGIGKKDNQSPTNYLS